MLAKSAVAATLLALAASTVATEPASQCNTGPVQCCQSTTSTITSSLATLLGLLGIDVQDVAVPIGLTCDPISIVGVGSGAQCSNQAVCCENNNFNGIVALGCTPVDLNL